MLGGINNELFFKSFSGFIVVAVLALILRWAYSGNKSLVEKQRRIGSEEEYGLLKVAHSPKNHIEGEILRQKLLAVGIKATLSQTKTGPKILVFEEDLKIAKATLATDN
ncbi:MAG: hypothetical protein EBV11_04550 [Actinobacteria bacterium]|nr:hypothetical protein [Actinomycetota bacterium]NBO51621.1 hypothetical protein [Actinomycetota bacterium]